MSKRIKKLEKENLGLREKTAKSDVAMINLLDERTKLDAKYTALDNKKQALEGLCRSLQVCLVLRVPQLRWGSAKVLNDHQTDIQSSIPIRRRLPVGTSGPKFPKTSPNFPILPKSGRTLDTDVH